MRKYLDFHPIGQLTEDTPLEFYIPSTLSHDIDLKDTLLYLKTKIVKGDGGTMPDGTKEDGPIAAPINLPLHTLFSQVDTYVQNKLISDASNNYAYKAYFQCLLGIGKETKEGFMQSQLYYKDTANNMDDVNTRNAGFISRAKYYAKSASVGLLGRPVIDLFESERPLTSGVDLRLKFWRNKNTFSLMARDIVIEQKKDDKGVVTEPRKIIRPDYKLILEEAVLKVAIVPHQPIQFPVRYPFVSMEMKMLAIAQGANTFTVDDLYQSRVPTRIVMALVDSKSVQGGYYFNPFNCLHKNLQQLAIYLDGQSVPGRPWVMDFDKGQSNYIEPFHALFEVNNQIDIKREEFPAGYAIFLFVLGKKNLSGNVRLELIFGKPLDKPTTLVIYAEFLKGLTINADHGVELMSS